MAFTFLDFIKVTSVCLNIKRFVNKGKGWYFFMKKAMNEMSLLLFFFIFNFTYLVVLKSIKIKHFSLMTMSNN